MQAIALARVNTHTHSGVPACYDLPATNSPTSAHAPLHTTYLLCPDPVSFNSYLWEPTHSGNTRMPKQLNTALVQT